MTTDLLSVDQMKASFMSITAHWIKTKSPSVWSLCSEVIAFKGISGAHSGKKLRCYFIGLCKWAGIINVKGSKVSSFTFLLIHHILNTTIYSSFVLQQTTPQITTQHATTSKQHSSLNAFTLSLPTNTTYHVWPMLSISPSQNS